MLFNEVIGQKAVKQRLIASVNEGRVPHAQLFFGPEGCGSLALAIAYAQYLACTNKTDIDACGECPSCRKIQKLEHPDLHFAFPYNATKKANKAIDKLTSDDFIADWRKKVLESPYLRDRDWYAFMGIENKQGIISKSEGENIARKLNLKSFESDYKFMIIWLPENLNVRAANSLLKLIEEPPAKTIFLLVSNNPQAVLPTISSRTQPVKLNPLTNEEVGEGLRKKFTLGNDKIGYIVRLANGNFIKAEELVDTSDKNEYYRENFKLMMRLAWKPDMLQVGPWVDELATLGREALKDYFEYCLHLIRDNFMLYTKNKDLTYLTDDEAQFSDKFHQFVNGRNVIGISNELSAASSDIGANAYAKIVLLDLVLKLSRLIKR